MIFKVGDKVAISSRNSSHELGVVVGYITDGKPDILVKVLCGGEAHNCHMGYEIHGDDGEVVSVPNVNEYYFFREGDLRFLGSTL